MKELQDKCSKVSEEKIEAACSKLPQNQQLAISACLSASKVKDLRGIRYSSQWIYECILLRIKSRKTYEHLRNRQVLVLPTIKTINRYIKAVGGIYGFQKSLFQVLKSKMSTFEDSNDARGCTKNF